MRCGLELDTEFPNRRLSVLIRNEVLERIRSLDANGVANFEATLAIALIDYEPSSCASLHIS